MGIVYPSTVLDPSPGAVITSAWGDSLNTAIAYIWGNAPRCKATRSTAQSISSSTETAVALTNEDYDVGGMHSTSSNTSRVTIPSGEGGTYTFWGWVQFDTNTTGIRELALRVNGSTALVVNQSEGLGSHQTHVNAFGEAELAAGDYVELVVWQDSGGALDLQKAVLGVRKVAE